MYKGREEWRIILVFIRGFEVEFYILVYKGWETGISSGKNREMVYGIYRRGEWRRT